MSNNDMNKTVREFYRAVEGVKSKKTGGYDVQATVRRVEDGVAWVHIPDGVDETPARLTINAKEGDVVQVRVVNGRAFLVGNASAPPTDNTEAIKALSQADVATQAATIAKLRADEATADAIRAHDAADSAQASADAAQDSADAASDALQSVVSGATTVEKAVSVMQTALEAVVDYDPTTDTTKEYFWHDANGAHVLGVDSGYRNDVDSSGMKIVNVNTEKAVAEFGASGTQIGETGTSHVYIDYHSLQLISREGSPYMHISDLRDRDGYAPFTDTFTGDGSTRLFVLSTSPTINTDHPLTVYVDDVETTYYCSSNLLTITPAPASGATIKATYYSTSTMAKAYTIGTRKSGTVGVESVVIGSYNVASGYTSYAEGSYTTASGYGSHAEGAYTKASGYRSHAEGEGSEARGNYSHAGGDHTIAYDSCQTAIGKYNKDETANLLFAIGNGTSDNNRSNAMTVDWDGVVTAASFVAPNIKCGELYLNGNETNVGFSKNRSNDSAVSLSAGGTGKTLATVDLEKGKWIVMCKVAFPDASATSYVRACFNTTGNSSGADMQIPSNSGASTTLNFTKFVNAASTTTYYLSASSYVARTIAAGNGQLWAVKIQ